jgi:dTMP kinase
MKRLIVVDGLDGCGKDTHANRIRRELELRGSTVRLMKHPSQRLPGRMSKTAFYTADVLTSVREFNRQKDGDFVFVRYLLGTAYLPRKFAPSTYAFFKKLLPFPDLAIFIDIEPSVALRRIEKRDHKREMFETGEKLSRVRETARSLVGGDWVIIDNSVDGEEPFQQARRVLNEKGMI